MKSDQEERKCNANYKKNSPTCHLGTLLLTKHKIHFFSEQASTLFKLKITFYFLVSVSSLIRSVTLQAPPNAHQLHREIKDARGQVSSPVLIRTPGKGLSVEVLWMMGCGEIGSPEISITSWRFGALRREPTPKPSPKAHFQPLPSAARAGIVRI